MPELRVGAGIDSGYVLGACGISDGMLRVVMPLDPGNLIEGPVRAGVHGPEAEVIVRSGWAGEGEAPAWMPGPRGRFLEHARETARVAGGEGWRPVLWARAEGAVSDVPSLLTFLRQCGDGAVGVAGWGFVLDPAGMLTPGMGGRVEDHVTRIVESLAEHPGLRAVVLRGVSWAAGVDGMIEGVWGRVGKNGVLVARGESARV